MKAKFREALGMPVATWAEMLEKVQGLRVIEQDHFTASLDDSRKDELRAKVDREWMIEKLQSLRWVGFVDSAKQNMELVVDVLIQHLKE